MLFHAPLVIFVTLSAAASTLAAPIAVTLSPRQPRLAERDDGELFPRVDPQRPPPPKLFSTPSPSVHSQGGPPAGSSLGAATQPQPEVAKVPGLPWAKTPETKANQPPKKPYRGRKLPKTETPDISVTGTDSQASQGSTPSQSLLLSAPGSSRPLSQLNLDVPLTTFTPPGGTPGGTP